METAQINAVTETANSGEKLFDLGFIDKISRGNTQVRAKLIRTFIGTIPPAVEELKQAHGVAHFQTLQETAHRIKPVLRFYAIVTVEQDVQAIEDLAKQKTGLPEIEQKISKLDTVVKAVIRHLETEYLND